MSKNVAAIFVDDILNDLKENHDKDKICLFELPSNDLRKIEALVLIYINLERINYRIKKSY